MILLRFPVQQMTCTEEAACIPKSENAATRTINNNNTHNNNSDNPLTSRRTDRGKCESKWKIFAQKCSTCVVDT